MQELWRDGEPRSYTYACPGCSRRRIEESVCERSSSRTNKVGNASTQIPLAGPSAHRGEKLDARTQRLIASSIAANRARNSGSSEQIFRQGIAKWKRSYSSNQQDIKGIDMGMKL